MISPLRCDGRHFRAHLRFRCCPSEYRAKACDTRRRRKTPTQRESVASSRYLNLMISELVDQDGQIED